MHMLALFVGTILGLILQPLPQGAVVILGVTLAAFTGTLTMGDALSGFANTTVWLIVSAFLFARGFIKTGLGRRISYLMIRAFGRSTLGLAYAIAASDLVIAPATPSNTARAGGILFPVVRSLAASFGSEPGPSARKAGAFLMLTEYQANLVTSAMAARELRAMGPMSFGEKAMLGVFLLTLVLWATNQWSGLHETAVALAGVALLVVVVLYLYLHYFIASMTAHVTAFFVPMAAVAIALGAPAYLVTISLGVFSSLNACLTHYGTGPAPIYFGAGYVDQGTWWKYGFLLSLVHIVVWLGIGGLWWRVLGLW